MIYGTFSIGRVLEESTCRTCKDYRFNEVGLYAIHSTSLMTNIPFEEANISDEDVDETIFVNDEETKIIFQPTIKCQNFLTTKYIGRAPLEFYRENQFTKMGRKFILLCREGNPNAKYRSFGTEDAIRGFNRGANDTSYYPEGGEERIGQ